MQSPASSTRDNVARSATVLPTIAGIAVCALAVTLSAGLHGCAQGKLTPPHGQGGAAGGTATSGSGGTLQITLGTAPLTSDNDAAAIIQGSCDGSDTCACAPLSVAVLGKPGKYGSSTDPKGDSDTALQTWLTSASSGTARVENFLDRKTLTADFLASYNVIILASLSDDSANGPWWTFTDDEVAAFKAWVENGGGVITLTGYANGDETRGVNQLIGFSGVMYNTSEAWANCVDQTVCNCTSSAYLTDWNRTDPVVGKLSTGVTKVGFVKGRSIVVPADAHVGATVGGQNVLVGKLVGKGRVIAFGDEWITYTSQWSGVGNPNANNPQCAGRLPQDEYQIPQFWYNMIHWSQPAASCFSIVDVPIW